MKRENLHLFLGLFGLLASTLSDAGERAPYDLQDHDHGSIMSGIAIVPPVVIERLVRQVIAQKLDADMDGPRFHFQTKPIHQQIQVPDDNIVLKDILAALGIKKTLNTNIAPIDVKFSLPMKGLNMKIRHATPGVFDVIAKWKVTQVSASSKQLNFRVPKGMFDRDFDIDSKPIRISLLPQSPAIQIELKLQVRLGDKGTRLKLVAFNTNLNDPNPANHPSFDFSIGPLTVDRQPLVLEVESNGRVLRAEEKTIREELEQLEPQFTAVLREEIETQVQRYFDETANTFSKTAPFKLKFSTNSMLSKPGVEAPVRELLRGIDAEFHFSSLAYLQKLDLFTAHIASHVCFDGKCLFNLKSSPIGADDLKPLAKTTEVGMLVYESWIQRVLHDEKFQDRIRNYYDTQAKAPGVEIGSSGVKVHLNPATRSIDAVFNLSIDIKKTATSKKANTKWKKVVDRAKKGFADWWEKVRGTGNFVVIPVEVKLMFQGYQQGKNGMEMVFKSKLPFQADGSVTNTYGYPSNISELTKMVRDDFLTSVRDTFAEVVPAEIRVPVPAAIAMDGVNLPLKNVHISPHRGLIFTAEVPEAPLK